MIRLDVDVSQFDGNDENNLRYMLDKISQIECPKIAELGCWAGHSTTIICEFLKKKGCGKVFSVDHFEGCETTFLNELAKSNNIKTIFENNIKELGLEEYVHLTPYDTKKASEYFENDFFDLIFIDADHRYEGIRSDIDLWLPKLKKGGIMCGHDFNSFDYNEKHINEDCVDGVHHGVTKAVLETFNLVEVWGSMWSIRNENFSIKSR